MPTTAIRFQDDRNFRGDLRCPSSHRLIQVRSKTRGGIMSANYGAMTSSRASEGARLCSISLPRSGAIEIETNRKWDPLRPIRVRRDPPTLEEAVVAAQGLSDDIEQQVEIASGLMGIPQEEVRPVIASAPPSETARGFERSSRAMPQVVVLRRRTTR